MKWVRFSKYTGEDFGIDTQDLMQALADFFLNSGFDNPYMRFSEWNQNTLESLKQALMDAIERGHVDRLPRQHQETARLLRDMLEWKKREVQEWGKLQECIENLMSLHRVLRPLLRFLQHTLFA